MVYLPLPIRGNGIKVLYIHVHVLTIPRYNYLRKTITYQTSAHFCLLDIRYLHNVSRLMFKYRLLGLKINNQILIALLDQIQQYNLQYIAYG